MTVRPIDDARDADLRNAIFALERAAKRAREIAIQTGTLLVVNRAGVTELLDPVTMQPVPAVHEPSAEYREDKPEN